MKYTVTGLVAEFGAGQQMKLSTDQIDSRRHALAIDDEEAGRVTATALLTFKRGEVVDIPEKHEDLARYLADALTPASRAKKADKRGGDTGAEERYQLADKALREAMARHGIDAEGRELTAEELAMVGSEVDAWRAAKAALDAANAT